MTQFLKKIELLVKALWKYLQYYTNYFILVHDWRCSDVECGGDGGWWQSLLSGNIWCQQLRPSWYLRWLRHWMRLRVGVVGASGAAWHCTVEVSYQVLIQSSDYHPICEAMTKWLDSVVSVYNQLTEVN